MSKAKSASDSVKALRAEKRKESWSRYCDSLKYSLHVITHPFDGFWDLIHEKKGTLAAAHTFLILFLVVRVMKLILTSFQFINAPIQHINIFEEAASLALPFLVLCVANWAMTTLFEGKGRFRDIYMAMCYALVPYILIQLPMVIISNGLTFEEGSIFSIMLSLIFLVVTVVGAMVIIFLVLTFFSLLSDAIAYFVSLYREIVYRLY